MRNSGRCLIDRCGWFDVVVLVFLELATVVVIF